MSTRFSERTQRTGFVDDFLPNVSSPYRFLRNTQGLPWVRPPDWLSTTPVAATEVCFLYAVYEGDSNFFSFTVTTSSGNFTVDWGDATSNSYASGTVVDKQFLWSSYSNVTTGGFRQAVVRVTGNITAIDFNRRHATLTSNNSSSQIVEITAQGSSITSFSIGSVVTTEITHSALQSFSFIGTCSITSMNGMFNNCRSLQSVSLPNTNAVLDMSQMFLNCTSLQSVSLPNTGAVTDMSSMFNECRSLQSVSLPDTGAVTNMSQMFGNCLSLQSVSNLNGNAATGSSAYSNMFSNCRSLQSISAINMKFTHSIGSLKMSATALNAYYTALPTVTSQTLTVTGNWGVATDNPSIATAKGWTVTG